MTPLPRPLLRSPITKEEEEEAGHGTTLCARIQHLVGSICDMAVGEAPLPTCPLLCCTQ